VLRHELALGSGEIAWLAREGVIGMEDAAVVEDEKARS
jgi:hypothetical protein